MFSPHRKVCWFAILSRIFIIILSAFFNLILPDHIADAFQSPQDPSIKNETIADGIIINLFGGLVRWDAQYFIHIAQYGYTYENCLAFFPLYPLTVRLLADGLYCIFKDAVSRYSLIVLIAVVVNLAVFVLSTSVLYKLSIKVLKNEQLAYKASILYCINPASIFFVAPYSETMYSCLTFYGMLKCGSGSIFSSSIGCGLPFGLAAVQRSNGILNIGFIFHERLKYFVRYVMPDILTKAKNLTNVFLAPLLLIPPVVSAISFLGEALLSVTPFVMFQGYAFYKFCVISKHNLPDFIVSHAGTYNLKLPGSSSIGIENHWCNRSIPLAYSYVQDHYWSVGFLRYYHWKQIPNFVLALPMMWIILMNSYRFMKQYTYLFKTLALWDDPKGLNEVKVLEKVKLKMQNNEIFFASGMFVYVVHIAFLTVFCLLCIHVQVTTRMIASVSPVLYWFTAFLFFKPPDSVKEPEFKSNDRNSVYFANRLKKISTKKQGNSFDKGVDSIENLQSRWKVFIFTDLCPSKEAKLIKYYFIAYVIIGTALFSNFLPWT